MREQRKTMHRALFELSEPNEAETSWSERLSDFKYADPLKSSWQIVNSALPFCGLWYLMYLSASWSYWLTLLLAVPTAGFLVRLFIIQHDCGHHSFFRSRTVNDIVGGLCGIITLTPYHLWRRTHSRHHASSGDLSHRGHGDVWVMTVVEYRGCSFLRRLRYRMYRHPLFMFVIGPALLFIVRQRFSYGIPQNWRRERQSVHMTNAGLLIISCAAYCTIGVSAFLLIHLPVMMLGAAFGSWLFFVQHQYEHAYWQPRHRWNFTRAALDGSSYYRLPALLQWFSGNIGFHHIHHLESRIPNYHLPTCYARVPELREAVTMGLWESLHCTRLKLWDEGQERMVSFAEARAHAA